MFNDTREHKILKILRPLLHTELMYDNIRQKFFSMQILNITSYVKLIYSFNIFIPQHNRKLWLTT